MRSIPHIRFKNGQATFRRKIPSDLVSRFGQREISVFLGLVSFIAARHASHELWTRTTDLYMRARENSSLTRTDLAHITQEFVVWQYQRDEDTKAAGKMSRLPMARDERLRDDIRRHSDFARCVQAGLEMDRRIFPEERVIEFAHLCGFEITADSQDLYHADRAMQQAMLEYSLGCARQAQASLDVLRQPRFIARFISLMLKETPRVPETPDPYWIDRDRFPQPAPAYRERIDPTSAPAPAPAELELKPTLPPELEVTSTKPAASPANDREFSNAWDDFINDKIDHLREWKESRRSEVTSTGRLWKWIIGDVPIHEINRRHLSEFRRIYMQLPANYHKISDRYDQRPEAIIKHGREQDAPRVNPSTFNKHLSGLKAFIKWCSVESISVDLTTQQFEGFHIKTRKGQKAVQKARDQFSEKQIETIFKAPYYTGRKSIARYFGAGDLIVRDSLFWVPLIAAYHGMRREEICQLRVRHVAEEDGILFFDLCSPELTLKNEQSERQVPLHRDLLRLGFIDQCVAGRDGEAMLFPELDNNNINRRYGDAVGKKFQRVLSSSGLEFESDDEDGGVHRFRHAFITSLTNLGANPAFIDDVTGHLSSERISERTRYTKEIWLQNKQATVDLLTLPIDIDLLNDLYAKGGVPPRPKQKRKAR